MRIPTVRSLAVFFAAFALAACDKSTAPGVLATITVTPSVSIAISTTQQFVAVGKDAAGKVMAIAPVWSVVAGGGAINTSGLFTAGTVAGPFAGTVKATVGTISGVVTVTVLAGPLATIALTPSSASVVIGATQQFTAAGKDASNNVVTITPVWTVVAGGGTISTAGLFTGGMTVGSFASSVVATSGSVSSAASVSVTAGPLATLTMTPSPASLAQGGTQQFTVVGKDAGNNVISVTPVWAVVAGGGTISSTGLFTAGSASGTFTNTVQALSGTVSTTATVTVALGALATIAVTPTSPSLALSATQQFTAVGKDAGNNVVAITPVWSIEASGGTISATGLFTAGTVAGTFTGTVKATSGAISSTASVIVNAGALATITVSPASPSLNINATQQFTAVGKDASNNVVVITPVWAVVASGGTISNLGLFTAGSSVGTFTNTVSATSGAIVGNATVTVTGAAARLPVGLGSAGNFVILAKSAISNVPTSAITGDLGISPAAASFITGFSLTLPAGGASSTSAQVTGDIYAPGYAAPTPTMLTTAVGDMETAYTDAAGRVTPDFNELGSGEIGGLTLTPGLYKWTNTVTIGSNVTLSGSATDVWIFQISGGITQASATQVILAGGALAKNVFWQSFGAVAIGTTAHMEGIILSQTSITLATGASANGRLFAQTAVSLEGVTVVKPAP